MKGQTGECGVVFVDGGGVVVLFDFIEAKICLIYVVWSYQ